MTECHKLTVKAGDHLRETIETLEKLCIERQLSKMSHTKYRRLIIELRDLSKLLAIYSNYDVNKPKNCGGNI